MEEEAVEAVAASVVAVVVVVVSMGTVVAEVAYNGVIRSFTCVTGGTWMICDREIDDSDPTVNLFSLDLLALALMWVAVHEEEE